METYTVRAAEPTILAGRAEYPLKSLDLWLGFRVDTAYVVPGSIDLDQFNDALSKALSIYPLFSGRMRRPQQNDEPWKISLTNHGVPLTVIDSDADAEVPHNCVVQSPWTLSQPMSPRKLWDMNSTEPLFRITITRFTKLGSTSIGLSGSHALGDGFTYLCFARHLSQFYQGLPPIDTPPTYNQPISYPYNPEDYGPISLPDLEKSYSIHDLSRFARPGRVKAQRIDVYFTPEQVAQIQSSVREQAPSMDEARKISRQDILIAFLVYATTKADGNGLPQRVRTVVNDRGCGSRPATAMTNCLINAITDDIADGNIESLYSIAQRVRRSIERVRDPGYAAAWDAARADKMLAMANAEMSPDFVSRPGSWVVNSTWRFDWTSAHFGYEGRTRFFHTLLDEPRYVKMFQPNPVLRGDGTVHKPAGVEITFYLHKEAKERFKDIFEGELGRLGITGKCKWL